MKLSLWLTNLINGRPSRRRNAAFYGVRSESLESRMLQTSAAISGGILKINGDENVHNNVEVTQANASTIKVRDLQTRQEWSFKQSAITGGVVEFNGKSGNDKFSNSTGLTCKVNGGDGNDNIVGGIGNDSLSGGGGNDSITGGDGNDSISGGDGNDYLWGSKGNDTVLGGSGEDNLWGWTGNDVLDGQSGRDIVKGEAGLDTLTGTVGQDILQGGADNDHINALLALGEDFDWTRVIPPVEGNDRISVSVDLNSVTDDFVKPVTKAIREVMDQFKPMLDLLDQKVPVVSYFTDITYGDLLSRATEGEFDEFATVLRNLNAFDPNLLPQTTVLVGTFTVREASDWISSDISDAFNNLKNNSAVKAMEKVGIEMPFFTDGKSLLKFVIGNDVDLLRFTPPALRASASFEKSYPIPVGGYDLDVGINAGFTFMATAAFGFDTRGMRTGDFMDGFYMENVAAKFTASLGASAGLSAGIEGLAEVYAGVRGGGDGRMTLKLNDPNGDGKTRLDEISSWNNAFKTEGSLHFEVSVYAGYDSIVGGDEYSTTLWAGDISLW